MRKPLAATLALSLSAAGLILLTGAAREPDGMSLYPGLDVRVAEAPVARLLDNLPANAARMTRADEARATARIHLLAYLRAPEGRTLLVRGDDGLALRRRGRSRPLPRTTSNPHLNASVAAYRQARDLSPDDLRTRLALAFVLDQTGAADAAREELRYAARRGTPRLQHLDLRSGLEAWETHNTLREVAMHLKMIGRGPGDRKIVVALTRQLDDYGPMEVETPILVPLADGLSLNEMIDGKSRVTFDFGGQGRASQLGWLTPKAAWLVWDPRGDGRIRNGNQLFGSATWLARWGNGYLPLAGLDDDADGRIAGAELDGLALWTDRNANGRSDTGEVTSLGRAGIVALSYDHAQLADGVWSSPRGVTFADGRTRPTYDWTFGQATTRIAAR